MFQVSSFIFRDKQGQAMLLTVLVISGTLMSISLIAGLLMLYQIRQAGDFTNSAKAIFAADSGIEWWLYNELYKAGVVNPEIKSSTVTFGNGQSFEVIDLGGGSAKIIGTAGNSRRALQIEPQAGVMANLIPCDAKLDMMILVDRSSSMLNLPIIKTKLKEFLDLLGVDVNQAHVGQVTIYTINPLRLHITTDIVTAKWYVDLINLGGANRDNLAAAIAFALAEFSNNTNDLDFDGILDHPPDHASPNPDYPDYMIIITDDQPNLPLDPPPGRALTEATDLASAAKTAGVEIFVVYQGTDIADVDFFKNNIVSSPSSTHFYSTPGFDVDSPLNRMLICGG